MAKFIASQLQPLWAEALESMPQRAAEAAKLLVGEQITSTKVLFTFALGWILVVVARSLFTKRKNLPPAIPGALPLLGNLLQLTEKKPHRTFTAWARKHGPIFSIQVGGIKQIVINSPELAKEVMVTKFESISKREMPMALKVLTRDKCMVAMSDYGEEHRMLKKLVLTNLLGIIPQKQNRALREKVLFGMIDGVFAQLKTYPESSGEVDVREYIKRALFPFSLTQVLGYVPESVEVPELGVSVSTWEMFEALVVAPIRSVINVDWRDFFPALKWVPNKSVEDQVRAVEFKRTCIMRALIREQRKRLVNLKEPPRFYADILLTQATHLSEKQLEQSVWEPIIESADTTLVTSEWIMYELAKTPKSQERLLREIEDVVGTERMVTEDDLPKLKYLSAVVKETLRQYPPVPLVPSRLIEQDITLGGYDIPKGWQVLINIYAIAKDPKTWVDPEKWDPERILNDTSLDMGFKNLSLMPFGAGKRMCAGITQAMSIIPMNVAGLVQHFKWELAPEEIDNINKKIEDVVYLTTHKLHPLKCIATPRLSQRLP